MKSRKQLQAEIRAAKGEMRTAERAVAFAHDALMDAQTDLSDAERVYDSAWVALKMLVNELANRKPAVAEAVLNAQAPKAEPMSVEKIARHLGYGASGRTRAELTKTVQSAESKVRAELEKSNG